MGVNGAVWCFHNSEVFQKSRFLREQVKRELQSAEAHLGSFPVGVAFTAESNSEEWREVERAVEAFASEFPHVARFLNEPPEKDRKRDHEPPPQEHKRQRSDA